MTDDRTAAADTTTGGDAEVVTPASPTHVNDADVPGEANGVDPAR